MVARAELDGPRLVVAQTMHAASYAEYMSMVLMSGLTPNSRVGEHTLLTLVIGTLVVAAAGALVVVGGTDVDVDAALNEIDAATVGEAAALDEVRTNVDEVATLNDDTVVEDAIKVEETTALLEVDMSDELETELDVVAAAVEVAGPIVLTTVPDSRRQGSLEVLGNQVTAELLTVTCRFSRRC